MKSRVTDATTGRPGRIILSMALPLMAGNIFQNLYSVVDTAVVGRWLGIRALAAVGNTGWLQFLLVSVILGITQGAGIHIANRFGAKDREGLKRGIAALIVMGAVLAVVMTALIQLFLRPVLVFLHFSQDIIDLSALYLRICFANIPGIVAYNAFDIILRSLGDTKSPFRAMTAGAVTNVILDVVFIAVFKMGVEGAALATVAGQLFSLVFLIDGLRRIREYLPGREAFRQNGQAVRKELKLSLPIALQHLITASGGLFVTYALNRYDVTFVAAMTATERLYGLLEMAGMALGYSFSVYIAQNTGAEKYLRVRKGTHATAIMALCVSLFISFSLILFGRYVLALFIADSDPVTCAQTMDIAYHYLTILCRWLPVLYVLHIFRCGLNGLSDTVTPMISGFVEFLLRAFMTMVAVRFWQENALLHTEITAWLGAAILLFTVYMIRQRRLPRTDKA